MPGTIVKMTSDQTAAAEGTWLKNQFSTQQDPHVHDLTGSSLIKGNFYRGAENFEHFAIGAPKAVSLFGRVYICFHCFSSAPLRKFDLTLEGHQFGARFGQAIAAVDIDGDGYDDLVVGAPLFSTKVARYSLGTLRLRT